MSLTGQITGLMFKPRYSELTIKISLTQKLPSQFAKQEKRFDPGSSSPTSDSTQDFKNKVKNKENSQRVIKEEILLKAYLELGHLLFCFPLSSLSYLAIFTQEFPKTSPKEYSTDHRICLGFPGVLLASLASRWQATLTGNLANNMESYRCFN